MFNKILIANRGEIACRVIKTSRQMGIHTVAIYSSVDKDCRHVKMADSAYWVGEAPAQESYLNIEAILDVAKQCGAEAIHPGYGFLSENPLFAKACDEAGIVFVGPSIAAMEAMASKQRAKQQLEKTSVPLTPGYHGHEQSDERLLAEARQIGFPILLKAANGGGGKGMRTVHDEADFSQSLASARRESMASFADDTMLIEKLISNPRHIEVQIMADHHGQIVHLFERDCSIQRRHQKIIEEAPAPHLPELVRQAVLTAACEVARSIHYRNAGTVEFLLDDNNRFYFMEMNTRLQVEHPVTEMITGFDLVAWQLKIASNEPLPCTQEEISAQGHAIECRIYAEDPFQEFIPSIGHIHFLKEPIGEGIRVDSGITCHADISMYYDPMIAKLIAFGETREEALQRLQQALAHYAIGGVKTNLPFLKAICCHPQFVNANLTTNFLTQETLELLLPDKQVGLLMAASYDYLSLIPPDADPLFQNCFAWQMHLDRHWLWRYRIQEELTDILITPIAPDQFKLTMHAKEFILNPSLTLLSNGSLSNIEEMAAIRVLSINDGQQIRQAIVENQANRLHLYFEQGPLVVERFHWHSTNAPTSMKKNQLTAPMPATIVAILKKKGDKVKTGDSLLVLEAMKMEHTIYAPKDGVLTELFYELGSQVNEGAELLALEG